MGFWSRMTVGPYISCWIMTDSRRRLLSIARRCSPFKPYRSRSADILRSPCLRIDDANGIYNYDSFLIQQLGNSCYLLAHPTAIGTPVQEFTVVLHRSALMLDLP